MKRDEQNHDDQRQREPGVQEEFRACLRFGFRGAAEFDEYARRQLYRSRDRLLRLLHDALQGTLADIERHADSPLPAVMLNAVSIGGARDVRHLGQRYGSHRTSDHEFR